MNTVLKFASLTLCAAISQHATAISFECKLDQLSRTIKVSYPEQTPVPCQVEYTKEGETEVLWTASSTEGYCETRAREFVTKHESWGWMCESQHISTSENTSSHEIIAAE